MGRALAYRCVCSGITSVLFDIIDNPLSSTRNKVFYDALLQYGLSLNENFNDIPVKAGIDYANLTDEQKQLLYPPLIEELRNTPDWGHETYPYSLRPKARLRKKRSDYQVFFSRSFLTVRLVLFIMYKCVDILQSNQSRAT